mmetsp:Transcript_1452/g.2739  ORF Transcript_1452/g.2739 Transcript_1452/m.2739 type:complete len:303 (+) Transcript_1452:101-1009(+)
MPLPVRCRLGVWPLLLPGILRGDVGRAAGRTGVADMFRGHSGWKLPCQTPMADSRDWNLRHHPGLGPLECQGLSPAKTGETGHLRPLRAAAPTLPAPCQPLRPKDAYLRASAVAIPFGVRHLPQLLQLSPQVHLVLLQKAMPCGADPLADAGGHYDVGLCPQPPPFAVAADRAPLKWPPRGAWRLQAASDKGAVAVLQPLPPPTITTGHPFPQRRLLPRCGIGRYGVAVALADCVPPHELPAPVAPTLPPQLLNAPPFLRNRQDVALRPMREPVMMSLPARPLLCARQSSEMRSHLLLLPLL